MNIWDVLPSIKCSQVSDQGRVAGYTMGCTVHKVPTMCEPSWNTISQHTRPQILQTSKWIYPLNTIYLFILLRYIFTIYLYYLYDRILLAYKLYLSLFYYYCITKIWLLILVILVYNFIMRKVSYLLPSFVLLVV